MSAATPPQGIDRDRAREGLLDRLLYGFSTNRDMDEIVDNALRFLETCIRRPVEGITLTPEEADLACTALRKVPWREQSNLDRAWALAARLEGC